jgi:hypothetical protein
MDALKHVDEAGNGTPETIWEAWGGFDRLPELRPDALVSPNGRALFVAPHPDDEVLGMGGLMVQLARLQRKLALVAVTDGDASHRDSDLWTPDRLRAERPIETREALQRLRAFNVEVARLRLGDGKVMQSETALRDRLSRMLRPDDVVVTTWRFDGHPADSRLPWSRARRLTLDSSTHARKRHAIEAFASQLEPDPSTGNKAILEPEVLAHWVRPFEVFLV